MGNSQGVIIPASLLRELNFGATVELHIENGTLVLSQPTTKLREGWANDAKRLAETGDDALLWPAFSSPDDEEWTW
jgi:antitoxin MazE